ncbi:hypothetical protein D3C71_990710 [compost metagenome]
MAKQVAFEQPRRHRRAVHFHHPTAVAIAEIVDCTGNQLFAGAGFAKDQHRAVALRHHFHLFEHAIHGIAAANNLAKFTVDVIQLFRQRQVLIHKPFFQAVDLLIGKGIIERDSDTLGNLAQQF